MFKAVQNFSWPKKIKHQEDYDVFIKACKGDHLAARQVVDAISNKGFMVAWRMLGDRTIAQDIVQDGLLKLFEKRPYRGESSLNTFFYVMITRLCLDHLNARSKAWQQDNEEDFISNIESNEKSAIESLHQSQTYSIVQKAILSLKPRQRAALVAWAYQDASINQIANMLEINANAATQLLHRAKLNLENSLRGLGYEE